MLGYSSFRGLKTVILNVPVLTPRLSSYWLVFITSVRLSLCTYLIESMKNNTVVKLKGIEELAPHCCLSYKKALELAFQNIAQNEVVSSWMDNWDIEGNDPNIAKYVEVPQEGCVKDQRKFTIKDSKAEAIDRIWQIGGDNGYYGFDWAWHLRGLIDQLFGGIGLNRGKRDLSAIMVGDSIDFWRVLRTDKENGHLILFSSMKVPGEAWLEFKIENNEVVQTATFRPHGVFGRLYWYALLPIHYFIFTKMAKTIAGSQKG